MTENLHIIALQEAVKVGLDSDNKAEAILAIASQFYGFLNDVNTPAAAPVKEPKVAKEPKKEVVKETPKPEPKAEPKVDLSALVKGKLKAMIEGGLREQASEQLKKQNAASATSLAEKGQEAVDEFINFCDDALLNS